MTEYLLHAGPAAHQTAANGGGIAPPRRADSARTLAQRLHAGDPELLAHVERVVSMVLHDAEAVAWLHESVEHAGSAISELRRADLGADEIAAVRLLTREAGTDSDEAYLRHLEVIAKAPGDAGRTARIVKLADLNDRLMHPRSRSAGWCPPYAEGIAVLEQADSESGLSYQRR